MRRFESGIPLLLAIYLLFPYPRPANIRLITAFAILLVLFHFGIEGYRWQMIPLYGLTLIILLVSMNKSWDVKPVTSYLTLILLAVSTALPILLPIPSIPAPSGPYQVGTRAYELTDASRKEIYSGKDEARRFMVQVWYPSETGSSDQRAAWMENAAIFAPAVANYINMPPFFLDHLALVKEPAFQESKIAGSGSGYPIILFSHGWNGFNGQNSGQAMQLASHGYVVVGIQHTYGAIITVFPDGTIANNTPSALPGGKPTEEYETAAHILGGQWADDMGYALDFLQLQNEDSSSPFYQSLDLSLVGVYGHSTGGGAAIQFCATDTRCKAVLGMDPFMPPVSYEVIREGMSQPSFFMFSQRWADDVDSRNNELFNQFRPNVSQSLGVIAINGTAHYDFTDLPLLSPLAPQLGLKGPMNGKRVTTIVNDYLLTFFDLTLNGRATDLFSTQTQKYDDVHAIQ
jgi:predicted dienelactone hydrolase